MGKPARRRWLPGSGRTWLREVGLALVAGGFVVLAFAAYDLVGTNLSEEHGQSVLAHEFATDIAHTPIGTSSTTTATVRAGPPSGGGWASHNAQPGPWLRGVPSSAGRDLAGTGVRLPPPGAALDHLVIPAINLSRYVVQGVDETDLQMGPGHYPGTPLPGQAGNVAIAGHRTTFGAPFFRLNEVSRGDLVLLTDTSGTTWVYRVVSQWVVSPDDTAVLDPTHYATLTLTTCNPRFEALSRLVVRAVLADRVLRGSKVPTKAPDLLTGQTGSGGVEPVTAVSGRGISGGGSGEGLPTVGPGSVSSPGNDAPGGHPSGSEAGLATIAFGLLALLGWVTTRVFAAHLRRYGKVLVVAAGMVVCLVPLWFAFENLVDLLPANI